jgi:hypothetical protein
MKEFSQLPPPGGPKLKLELKRAASQEAVTLPWLSAHSIRTGIGGNVLIVDPPVRLSSLTFVGLLSFPFGNFPGKKALQSLTPPSLQC